MSDQKRDFGTPRRDIAMRRRPRSISAEEQLLGTDSLGSTLLKVAEKSIVVIIPFCILLLVNAYVPLLPSLDSVSRLDGKLREQPRRSRQAKPLRPSRSVTPASTEAAESGDIDGEPYEAQQPVFTDTTEPVSAPIDEPVIDENTDVAADGSLDDAESADDETAESGAEQGPDGATNEAVIRKVTRKLKKPGYFKKERTVVPGVQVLGRPSGGQRRRDASRLNDFKSNDGPMGGENGAR